MLWLVLLNQVFSKAEFAYMCHAADSQAHYTSLPGLVEARPGTHSGYVQGRLATVQKYS
jgi:hypothetical protein